MIDNKVIDSKLIAHRFGAGLGPENTRGALLQSVALGVRWVEFDVCLLKGESVVVFHDSHFDRCTDHTGEVAKASLADTRTMDVGSWFGEQFRGEKILELGEALVLLQQHGVNINLELKVHADESIALTEQVHRIVQKKWHSKRRLIYSSFNQQASNHLRQLDADANIGYLLGGLPSGWLQQAKAINAITVHGDARKFSEEDIRSVKAAGYLLYLYTVNNAEAAQALIDAGADGIFTDYPNLFDRSWF